MATNTLGEFSDGEDDFVFEIDENLWKRSDPEAWEWSDPEADDLIRNINEEEVLAGVYGNDDDDDVIRNINEDEVLARVYGNDDDVIRNINEEEILGRVYGNDIDEDEVQTGRGEKRKSEDEQDEQGQYYYHLESRKKYYSKKFGMTATDYLTNYQIIIVSGAHNNSIIYPPKPPGTDEKPIISLYFHNNHFDVITKLPGFLNKSYFCKRCHKGYNTTTDHICSAMCRSCRGFGCVLEGEGIVCNECTRLFKSQACYDHHKNDPIDGGGRTVCEVIRRCEKCGNAMDVRKIKDGGHICGKKCRTCGLILNQEDNDHKCYIQQLKQEEESSYNHLLFFDFEATQEHGTHCPNLCVVHDEEREVALFQGEDTVKNFCEWLFTPEHKDCIVVAHNFQGYDGYFINEFLNDNAIHYEIIYRGAKSLSMTVPLFNIKFIDSINFIPMSLAKFPKTFGQDELCKGYFPHMFNKEENQNYIGPIPCQNDYGVNFMKPGEREAFMVWHDEQVANNYRYDFREEIIKYCRSDVDILRKCCLLYREMFRKETGIDPFNKALTIASYCQEVYRTNFLKKDTIAVFNNDRQLKIKQSNVAVKWLSYISEKEDLCIQHGRNGGEKRFNNYSLDGYCEETLTAYEFQGCFWHGKDFGNVTYTNYGKNINIGFFSFYRLSRMLQR